MLLTTLLQSQMEAQPLPMPYFTASFVLKPPHHPKMLTLDRRLIRDQLVSPEPLVGSPPLCQCLEAAPSSCTNAAADVRCRSLLGGNLALQATPLSHPGKAAGRGDDPTKEHTEHHRRDEGEHYWHGGESKYQEVECHRPRNLCTEQDRRSGNDQAGDQFHTAHGCRPQLSLRMTVRGASSSVSRHLEHAGKLSVRRLTSTIVALRCQHTAVPGEPLHGGNVDSCVQQTRDKAPAQVLAGKCRYPRLLPTLQEHLVN